MRVSESRVYESKVGNYMSDKNIDICNEVELGNTIEDNAISLLADSGKCSDSEARGRIRLL